MSIKASQVILKCFIDLKSSVFQKQQTQLKRVETFPAGFPQRPLWRQTSLVTPCFGQKIVTNI